MVVEVATAEVDALAELVAVAPVAREMLELDAAFAAAREAVAVAAVLEVVLVNVESVEVDWATAVVLR